MSFTPSKNFKAKEEIKVKETSKSRTPTPVKPRPQSPRARSYLPEGTDGMCQTRMNIKREEKKLEVPSRVRLSLSEGSGRIVNRYHQAKILGSGMIGIVYVVKDTMSLYHELLCLKRMVISKI